ncbi:hypothetical protein [Chelativorans xinjiangense]|uniref:hypothetical protein n=1 Tax=Chelativorans xinjiangense TaxID=2681485 RepID=UPI001359130A|nr:hypothetical protein [Chelativorans xinjiangense]
MSKVTFETLRALNREMFGGRWSEDDLRQLVDPRFGVVSDFESMLHGLERILDKDLGDLPPDSPVAGCGE